MSQGVIFINVISYKGFCVRTPFNPNSRARLLRPLRLCPSCAFRTLHGDICCLVLMSLHMQFKSCIALAATPAGDISDTPMVAVSHAMAPSIAQVASSVQLELAELSITCRETSKVVSEKENSPHSTPSNESSSATAAAATLSLRAAENHEKTSACLEPSTTKQPQSITADPKALTADSAANNVDGNGRKSPQRPTRGKGKATEDVEGDNGPDAIDVGTTPRLQRNRKKKGASTSPKPGSRSQKKAAKKWREERLARMPEDAPSAMSSTVQQQTKRTG